MILFFAWCFCFSGKFQKKKISFFYLKKIPHHSIFQIKTNPGGPLGKILPWVSSAVRLVQGEQASFSLFAKWGNLPRVTQLVTGSTPCEPTLLCPPSNMLLYVALSIKLWVNFLFGFGTTRTINQMWSHGPQPAVKLLPSSPPLPHFLLELWLLQPCQSLWS